MPVLETWWSLAKGSIYCFLYAAVLILIIGELLISVLNLFCFLHFCWFYFLIWNLFACQVCFASALIFRKFYLNCVLVITVVSVVFFPHYFNDLQLINFFLIYIFLHWLAFWKVLFVFCVGSCCLCTSTFLYTRYEGLPWFISVICTAECAWNDFISLWRLFCWNTPTLWRKSV